MSRPVTIPQGARVPLGAPAQWLEAADAADWQCQCATPAGSKSPCGRSHRRGADVRCPHRAAGVIAPVRLVVILDATGAPLLLCGDCAPGHARTAARQRAAAAALEQPVSDTLF